MRAPVAVHLAIRPRLTFPTELPAARGRRWRLPPLARPALVYWRWRAALTYGFTQLGPHPLDEAVSALDVSVQAQVLALFAQVREQFQLAMVFVTHDLRVAGQMCDYIAVMQHGGIVEYGETRKVLSDPRHAYTRKLIDAAPKFPAFDSGPLRCLA